MAGGIARRLAKSAPANRRTLFKADTITSFDDIIDPNLRRAVANLDENAQDELVDLATKALSRHQGADALLKRCGELIGTEYHKLLETIMTEEVTKSGVPFLFHGNLRGFNNSVLDREFRCTLDRRQARSLRTGRDYGDLNALEWALDANRSLAARAELERLFGPNYGSLLRNLKQRKMTTRLNDTQIRHYDDMVGLGINDYGTLAEKNKYHGHLYEVDHLLEQRFWNVPDNASSLAVKEQSLAIVVPKDSQIANLLQVTDPRSPRPIKYVHSEKTRMLRNLIPHGKEHLFTTQQIWDAHIHTFDVLELTLDRNGQKRIEDMFKLYINGLRKGGQPNAVLPKFHWKPSAATFSPSNGWPTP